MFEKTVARSTSRRKTMYRLCAVRLLLPLSMLAASTSRADMIYESATMGARSTSGDSLLTSQFIGTRFYLAQTVAVSDIGGHIFGSGTLFGAIVSLSSSNALPSGGPFNSTLLAETLLTAPTPSADIRALLSVTLPPGEYGLI